MLSCRCVLEWGVNPGVYIILQVRVWVPAANTRDVCVPLLQLWLPEAPLQSAFNLSILFYPISFAAASTEGVQESALAALSGVFARGGDRATAAARTKVCFNRVVSAD